FKGDTRVIIAPDGELTRLPFEALPTDDGRRLIDAYRISYLSVGRDVLRFAYNTPHEPNASVVVADPDYDLGSVGSSVAGEKKSLLQKLGFSRHRPSTSTTSASHDVPSADELRSTAAARQSRDLARSAISVKPLPYAKEEGRAIGAQLKVTPWLREQALEGRLKATASPHILHVATHGFFLENQQRDALMQSQISRFADLIRSRISTPQATSFADLMLDRIATSGMENPLLRSGLVLAGVNTYFAGGSPPPMAEDGVLTAWDVSGLDLLATDLAVLSACETGLGDVQTGEGVFGLRRAFMLAGVKTLVMSLWAVDDKATKELMVDFYSRVLNGEGRADALRNAQLTIKAKHPEPYYWGAFICQGNPSPLNSIKSSSMA
ncbi:MAG: CHAT domain-containing protein, partial [Halobacteriota archaeon]